MIQINDLYDYQGLKVYQDNQGFKFSLDSLLIAEFVNIKLTTKTIVDFCTGIATIPLILSKKSDLQIIGIEIQEKVAKLAKKNLKLNNIKNIQIINDNVINAKKYIKNVDIVSCNPPYFKYQSLSSLVNRNIEKSIARHEIEATLEEIVSSASNILKDRGHFYLSHRPERLLEITLLLEKYNLKIKKLQFIYSNIKKNAIIVLIDACKNGNINGLIVKPAIDISNYTSYQNIFKEFL